MNRISFLVSVLAMILAPCQLLSIDPSDDQPHMRAALGHLEAAKTAKDPVVSLRAARKQLLNAASNKAGQRKDAIGYVDEAIALAVAGGDKGKLQEKISKAISNVKSGIARAK